MARIPEALIFLIGVAFPLIVVLFIFGRPYFENR
jgi:hypothetical protein